MATKTYKAATILSFPTGKGRITFNEDRNTYTTNDVAIQKDIEMSAWFEDGRIKLIKGSKGFDKTDEPQNIPLSEVTPIDDVTSVNKAIELLTSEAYGVDKKTLKSKKNVLEKAKELGISFPNLK